MKLQKLHNTSQDKFILSLIESKQLTDEENLLLTFIYEHNVPFNIFERDSLKSYIQNINEANLIDWFKDKAKSASDNVKKILNNVITNFNKFIDIIIDKIVELIKKVWETLKEEVNLLLDSHREKIEQSLKKLDQAKLKIEIEQLKDMIDHATLYFTTGMVDDIKKSLEKSKNVELNEEILESLSESIKENPKIARLLLGDINESLISINEEENKALIPVISKIAHTVAKLPPFNWLHSIEKFFQKSTNKTLEQISVLLTKKAGLNGPYKFELIGKVFGLVSGYLTKLTTKIMVKKAAISTVGSVIAATFPGISTILVILANLALALWIVGVAETAVAAI